MRGEASRSGGVLPHGRAQAVPRRGVLTDTCAVLLVGGQGTRLRAVVDDRPKPLAEVAGRPFLCFLLDQLHAAGIREAVLCCGYRAEQVQAVLGASYRGIRLRYAVEAEPHGTAGALRQALPLIRASRLLLLNGDSICRTDLRRFLFETAGEDFALVATQVPEGAEYGRLELAEDGRVLEFCEKDGRGGPAWINAGIYALSRARAAALPDCLPLSLEREVLPLQADLRAWRSQAPFLDIGTPARYAQAEAMLGATGPGLLLLDRDGTVIHECHYLDDPDRVELLPGAVEGLARLQRAGYRLALVTNQSGIGRGFFDMGTLSAIHARLEALLQREGILLEGIWFCPHLPFEQCKCRKPAPGLMRAACAQVGVEPADCVVVGDKDCDIELAEAVEARAVLVRSGYGAATEAAGGCDPDLCVDDLSGLAAALLDEPEHQLPRLEPGAVVEVVQ